MAKRDLVMKHALANAFRHNGKANIGAVIGKVLGECPELRSDVKDVQAQVVKIVKEVNALSAEEQEKKLLFFYPDFLDKKAKPEVRDLPELPNAQKGKVVTRLGPEPNGYLHIGHAVSFFFNEHYAKKYDGKLVLRFEDTNPEKEKKEFYESIAEDLAWLGIKYDERKNNSDDMELFYEHAQKLIETGNAYVCQCHVDQMRQNRFKGKECSCRKHTKSKNLELWSGMLYNLNPGDAVLRLKADMKAKNTVMRDPTLFRIVEAEHPIQGTKYRVWPLYDFANAVEDAVCSITHVLRSNEFQQRDELQNKIRDLLGLENPIIISYSRINVKGTPTSKRQVQPLIDAGDVTGWDDPRLVTIKGLERRGILPETLRELALEVRMTKGSTTIDQKTIFGVNRKILDKQADRYFFVQDPVKLKVKDAPEMEVKLKLHPDYPDRGFRKVKTKSIFYIPAEDEKNIKKNEIFRFKDLYNVKYMGSGKAVFDSEAVKQGAKKIHWVTEENVPVEVIIPKEIGKNDMPSVKGLGEKKLEKVKLGSLVQLERFSFCKKIAKNKFIMAHK